MKIENETVNVITQIERYQNLIKKEKEIVDDHQTIIDSLTDSLVREVRNVFIPYSDKMMYEASCQQNNTKKSEKKMFLFFEEDLIDRLFYKYKREDVDIKLDHISRYGYGDYAYGFHFKYNDGSHEINFEFRIPNVKKANVDNIYYMNYGKYYLLYEKNSGYWNSIKKSYDIDEIAAALDNFLIGVKFFQKG